ncbi:esterase-like activity of phytase family protein [Sphingomonas sp. PWP1-2]|uniref:esterase-like activity of phytase family protein n=1 Tax=Sphingomonas sp. PWP1-2 TaxID=2804558 RepID=UPI003CEEBC91
MTDEPYLTARVTRLAYIDEELGSIDLPRRSLIVTRGLGSGLAHRAGEPADRIWAIGDRGPNLKIPFAIDHYGIRHLDRHAEIEGAKVMPCLNIGPAISELRIEADRVVHVRTMPLRDRSGRQLSGAPIPGGFSEPAFDLDGAPIHPDPSGADTEGIAAAADGTFWIADEYGPSLLHVAADGTVLVRWVPEGCSHWFRGVDFPVVEALPAIAARRQLNRGFEGLALSEDETSLYLAFQSPLAHPDEHAHRRGRHVRIWNVKLATGTVVAEYLYPLDEPDTFRRDIELGRVQREDIKVSELVAIGGNRLLVLERGSATTKLYAVVLDPACVIDRAHLNITTRPTLEELSESGEVEGWIPQLVKTLVFTTDDHRQVDADLEGIALLSPRSLLLVNDNDFGIESVPTSFWRIDLASV